MVLFMKEKNTAFTDRFIITDEENRIHYTAESKRLSLNGKQTIYDAHDRALAVVQKKPLALTPKYAVLVEGEEVALLSRESALFGKPYYKVEGPDWTVDGDIWDKDYKVRRNMNTIIDVSPALMAKDTYKINIHKDINPLMAVAVALAIDCILDAEGEAAVRANNTEG